MCEGTDTPSSAQRRDQGNPENMNQPPMHTLFPLDVCTTLNLVADSNAVGIHPQIVSIHSPKLKMRRWGPSHLTQTQCALFAIVLVLVGLMYHQPKPTP